MSSYSYKYAYGYALLATLEEDEEDSTTTDDLAPVGQVYMCMACGKRSKSRVAGTVDEGWDISCTLRAVLCEESSLVLGDNGRVRQAKAVRERETEGSR